MKQSRPHPKSRELKGNTGITWLEYAKIHHWIKRQHGKASKCDHCGEVGRKKYDWALKKGKKYERNVENFIQLCVPCHRRYDFEESTRVKLSKINKGRICPTLRPVVITNGLEQKEFKSLTEAAKVLNISRTGISNALAGRAKTAGGYICKYLKEIS